MKHISRIDQPEVGTHGWQIRIHSQGKYNRKFFSDSVHGGREKALKKAQKYRDAFKKYLQAKKEMEEI
ncbi:MAG: hypothetical protein ACOC90_04650 [Bacteroidota bacterium]